MAEFSFLFLCSYCRGLLMSPSTVNGFVRADKKKEKKMLTVDRFMKEICRRSSVHFPLSFVWLLHDERKPGHFYIMLQKKCPGTVSDSSSWSALNGLLLCLYIDEEAHEPDKKMSRRSLGPWGPNKRLLLDRTQFSFHLSKNKPSAGHSTCLFLSKGSWGAINLERKEVLDGL